LTPRAPFLFIVGCGRSGTTLLRAMLDSHPLMAVPPESYFVAQMATRRRDYEADGTLLLERFIADLENNPRYRKWGLDRQQLLAALEPTPGSLADAVRRVFQAYADSFGKPR
jgi:hypothetical protein